MHRERGKRASPGSVWTERRLGAFFGGISAFLKFLDFRKCTKKKGRKKKKMPQQHKLNILQCSHNQACPPSAIQIFHLCFFFFFWSKSSSSPNVSARDLACRQASLWLTHSSEWESFLPGGTVIPVKWWISFNVPVSNACQSKCQVLTSVITWMFHGWFLLFT